ncbi:MAG TPA: SRPBCC family protein [Dehalococcoidia bacterium]
MARVELDIHVNAPIDRVWQLITDLDTQERWMEDVHSLDVVYRTPSLEGSVIKVTSKLFGVPLLHDVMVITKVEAPRTLEIVHTGAFSGKGAFRLTEEGEGTKFSWEEEFEPPLGQAGEMAVAHVIEPHLRQVWGKSMQNVKRLAEAATAA